ncbi:exonuclease 1 isoform X2 [Athalia rosae]|uniref:exonuclease 1 isoform X2 n=2 Tax=Athalia rosae TaxID=37344 RepID=UPI002033EFCC|nr:exonuclease 1 isoform X2 [Athalia rosae]
MGITGLLPFLEKSSTKGNISQFAGGTVAIDSYCWLHKGAFSCAEKLAHQQPTTAYVTYCLKFVNMLLANNIKPILVFDGCHLPAKKDTESKRRELRDTNRRRAAQLIRSGQTAEGRSLLRRSIDVSHEMALNLIKACHELNVDCIVAPYEADSQLAYLNISGIADVVITEDSDLTLFGCKKIFFKMDLVGNGVLVEQERFYLDMGVRSEHFDMNKFRHMCILSGCDYLPSLPGIGLSKACKFIKMTTETDIHKALNRLSSYLNMKSLDVSKEYRDAFVRADITFKHQLVFCPFKRKQVRLTPPTPDVTLEQLHFAGKEMPEDLAWQLAIGNYDPMTLKKLHDYDPDTYKSGKVIQRTNSWETKPIVKHKSIWSADFKIKRTTPETNETTTLWPNTHGKVNMLKTTGIIQKLFSPKRNYEEVTAMEPDGLLKFYMDTEVENNKRFCTDVDVSALQLDTCSPEKMEKSPILVRRANPFVKKTHSNQVSPSVLDKGKQRSKFRNLTRFQPTVIESNVITQSKFFATTTDPQLKQDSLDSDKLENPAAEVLNYAHETDNSNGSEVVAVINESTCISDSICEKQLADASSALSKVDNSSIPAIDTSNCDEICRKEDYVAVVDTRILNHVDSLHNLQPDSTRPNLSQWSNTKTTDCATFVAMNPVESPNNGRTFRGMQGAAKLNDVSRARVNKKFQPVKKKSQIQGQQCLLSAFGFQKKTGLQH